MDEFKEALKPIIAGLSETYSKPISSAGFTLYLDILREFNIDDIKKAVNKHMVDPKHGAFFPKPADIIRNMNANKPSSEDKANIAWMSIESQIRRKGAYGSLELDDKQALMAVKHMGSWQSLCHTDIDKMQWKRKEFIENYKSLENTDCSYLEKLEGIEDLQNQRIGISKGAKAIADISLDNLD